MFQCSSTLSLESKNILFFQNRVYQGDLCCFADFDVLMHWKLNGEELNIRSVKYKPYFITTKKQSLEH